MSRAVGRVHAALRAALAVAVLAQAAGCAGERDAEPAEVAIPADAASAPDTSSAADAFSSGATTARPGIRFDPATARPGDRIGELVLDVIEARPNVVDSTLVGTARFRGSIELTGRRMEHPDADLRAVEVCFEANAVSAARLPRWLHDERRPWFCLTNDADAAAKLAGQGEVTIVVDQFTIHRGLTDAVNSARLVK